MRGPAARRKTGVCRATMFHRRVSADPNEHVERIGYYVGLGFRHLVFHAPGPDQARFLKLYSEHVLPRLRKRFG